VTATTSYRQRLSRRRTVVGTIWAGSRSMEVGIGATLLDTTTQPLVSAFAKEWILIG
jgi:hypothetical protein